MRCPKDELVLVTKIGRLLELTHKPGKMTDDELALFRHEAHWLSKCAECMQGADICCLKGN